MTSCFRMALCTFVFFIGGMSHVCAIEDQRRPEDLFSQAVLAYHASRYDEAAALNEEIISKGFVSAPLYYNLGNAHFRLGRLGKAIVNYERAMRLTPRDGDLRANLSFARSIVENYKPWPQGSIFSIVRKFWSLRELQWVSFALFVLTGAVFLVALFAGFPRKRMIFWVSFLAVVSGYFIGAAVVQSVNNRSEAVCIEKIEARFEPNPKATMHFKISEGTQLKVLREKEGWFKIERSDGKIGWVPSLAVERL